MSYRTHPPGVEIETNKLQFKRSVRVVATDAVTLTGGVGTLVIDGVSSFSNGDRIILAGQAGGANPVTTPDVENGIYTYSDDGVNYTLDRADDFNEDLEVDTGAFALANEGTTESNTGWKVDTTGAINPGTDAFTWLKIVSPGGAAGAEELSTAYNYADNNPAITGWVGGTTDKSLAIDQLNETLGKLIPSAPTNFPSGSLVIQSTQTFKQASGGATPLNGNTGVTAGNDVEVRFASSFSTNTLVDNGPGDSGTLSGTLNGASAGSVTITGSTVDTHNGVVDFSNNDGFPASGSGAGFWDSFDVRGASQAGFLAVSGYNEISITHSGAGSATSNEWLYDDQSTTPNVIAFNHSSTSTTTASSSSVPHLQNGEVVSYTGNIDLLAGWSYRGSNIVQVRSRGEGDTFADGDYVNIASQLNLDPGQAGIPSIIAENSGASSISGNITLSDTHSQGNFQIRGRSPTNDSAWVTSASPIVLVMGSATTSRIDEDNIDVNSLGTTPVSANAERVSMAGDSQTDTPNATFTATTGNWNGASALADYDAAVVGGVLNHNTVDYSTGFYPVGPDLSTGTNPNRANAQYITFWFRRTPVSKFDIQLSGEVSGCWVKLVGISDNTVAPNAYWDGVSGDNGWWDMTTAYQGAGVPGTGTNANGSTGCALAGTIPTGTTINNQGYTCTFGPQSSANATNNAILVRFRLDAGDKITELQFTQASN